MYLEQQELNTQRKVPKLGNSVYSLICLNMTCICLRLSSTFPITYDFAIASRWRNSIDLVCGTTYTQRKRK